MVSSCRSLRFCGSIDSVYQAVLFCKMDCLIISGAWISRGLERVKLSSLARLWGSDLKSLENFSCEIYVILVSLL